MSAIGPGDFVECIQPSGTVSGAFGSPAHGLVLGAVYQVASLHTHPWGHETLCVAGLWTFGEIVCGHMFCGYCVSRFRPIYRPRADFLESLLTPADAPSEREGVDA